MKKGVVKKYYYLRHILENIWCDLFKKICTSEIVQLSEIEQLASKKRRKTHAARKIFFPCSKYERKIIMIAFRIWKKVRQAISLWPKLEKTQDFWNKPMLGNYFRTLLSLKMW